MLGALNSLSQLALKLTIPGIPDIYQGTEFWDLSLVDPDNRRPIDFDARTQFIREPEIDWSRLVQSWPDGRIKFALLHRLLVRCDNSSPTFFCTEASEPSRLPATMPNTSWHSLANSDQGELSWLWVGTSAH